METYSDRLLAKEAGEKESVINTDRFDRNRFQKMLEVSPTMQETLKMGLKNYPCFTPLMGDVWASLYKLSPQIKEKEEVGESYQINRSIMERIMSDEAFSRFHETTKLDDLSSALGTMNYSEKIYNWLETQQNQKNEFKKSLKDVIEQQVNLDNAKQTQQEAQEQLEEAQRKEDKAAQTSAKRKVTNSVKKEQVAQEALQQALQQMNQMLDQQLEHNGGELIQSIQEATKKTKETKEALKSLFSTGSNNGEGELKKLPLKDQIMLAEQLAAKKKLKQIAELAGKFKSIARKKQKVKHKKSVDRSGLTFGTDVERLLPQELALFKNPLMRTDFLRRFVENGTMMFSPEGKETLGKGPIVLVLDQSGSMKRNDEMSKGFALALAMIAKKQRRDFSIIPFSNQVQKTFDYEKGRITPRDLVELAQHWIGGGTNYVPALEAASETITNKKSFQEADIIFVTDGEPSDHYYLENIYQYEFKKFKGKFKVNVISLMIGGDIEKYCKFVFGKQKMY